MKIQIIATAISLLALSGTASAAADGGTAVWTLADTINATLDYAPALKKEQAAVEAAQEAVEQAKSGYKPRLDIEASAGASTTQIPRHE